jgi:hypothetical protein
MKARIFIALIALIVLFFMVPVMVSAQDTKPVLEKGFNWIILLYVAMVSLLGIVLLVAGYFIWELITPYSVKLQLLEQKNIAVAIVASSFVIGMAIIIAAALVVFR